jgi:hexosaminidase
MSPSASAEDVSPRQYSVLPEPQHIEYGKGMFHLKPKLTIAYPNNLANEANLLKQYLSEDFSVQSLLKGGNKKADIVLSIDASFMPEHSEAYVLNVQSKTVSIRANSPAGILHGVQTLRQIIDSNNGILTIRSGCITDYPTFGWRAFMLDEARYFKGKEVVFRLLDNMSRLKMNVFHWHLVDDVGWRIEIKKYPKLTEIGAFRDSSQIVQDKQIYDGKPHGGFYTQDEIRQIVDYAAARHITIVPEIEMPGHVYSAIVAYPWLGTKGLPAKMPTCFCGYDLYDITKPEVISFLHDVLEEVMDLFPSKVIHTGGDEVGYDDWKNSPSVQQYMKDNNIQSPNDLQLNFTNQMSQWIASKNRTMIGWNEISGIKINDYWISRKEEDYATQRNLAPGTIVHCWTGNPKLFKEIIQLGYNIVNSSSDFTYLNFSYKKIPLEKAYSFNPIPEGLTAEQQKQVLGLGCQMWCEWVPDEQKLNEMVYPRIAAYAECGWTSADRKDYNRFLKALEYFLKIWGML